MPQESPCTMHNICNEPGTFGLQRNGAKELSLVVFLRSLFHQMASCQKLKARVASRELLFTPGWLLFFDMVTEVRENDAAQAPRSMVT